MESNVKEQVVFKQPKTFDERRQAAAILVDRLKYRAPLALDGIEGVAERAYGAWPERIYIIGTDGKVFYKGGMGPFDFHPDEAEKKLAELLSNGGRLD
jgi:iodothyronine deiodinase-like protein